MIGHHTEVKMVKEGIMTLTFTLNQFIVPVLRAAYGYGKEMLATQSQHGPYDHCEDENLE